MVTLRASQSLVQSDDAVNNYIRLEQESRATVAVSTRAPTSSLLGWQLALSNSSARGCSGSAAGAALATWLRS